MKIALNKLTLENFKGIKSLSIGFSDKTSIYGANATGKTTIFDAFTWLLFNKDSEGKTDFGIKTWDENNQVINRLEHSVEGILSLGDKEVTLKKIHKQKWVKKKGSVEETLEGSENSFYWNEVPVKEKDYQDKIKEIIDPDLFTLITSPNKFNSLNWKNKHDILFDLAGGIKDEEIISANDKLKPLLAVLNDKSFEEYKKELSAKKSKLKDDLKTISPRIDEVHKSIVAVPEYENVDSLKKELAGVEASLLDTQKAYDEYQALQREKHKEIDDLELRIQQVTQAAIRAEKMAEFDKSSKLDDIRRQIKTLSGSLKNLQDSTVYNNGNLVTQNKKLEELRQLSKNKKLETFSFDENLCSCPMCKRAFDESDIETKRIELEANFNKNKVIELELIKDKGIAMKVDIEKTESNIKANEIESSILTDKIDALNTELQTIESEPIKAEEAFTRDLEIALQDAKDSIVAYSDEQAEQKKASLTVKKQELQLKIELSQKAISVIESNKRAADRIVELNESAKNTAELIASLEGQEFLLEEFTRDKINYTEDKINSLFSMAKFKMFHYQVNGGVAETCETMYQGVPYSDLNTAARINVGLDIINALTAFYGVTAPIFIDNRESVTDIIETDSQVVNLIVCEKAKSLMLSDPNVTTDYLEDKTIQSLQLQGYTLAVSKDIVSNLNNIEE